MFILIQKSNNSFITSSESAEYGYFPENEPETELWKLKVGEDFMYALKSDFDVIEVESIPQEVLDDPEQYFYTEEKGFYKE